MSQENKSKRKHSALSIVVLVLIVLLILAAVGLAVATFILSMNNGQGASDGNVGNYLVIFSILFTLLAIILPFASYLINKDEIKKINKDVEQTKNQLKYDVNKQTTETQEKYQRLAAQVEQRLDTLDVRYVELLESFINRGSIKCSTDTDHYLNANVLYVNALRLFRDGNYDASLTNIERAIDLLGKLDLCKEQETYGDRNVPLLVYKVFELYRSISGRIRFSQGNLIGKLKEFLDNLEDNGNCAVYKIVLYLYGKSRLDKVEKTFVTQESLDDLDYLLDKTKPENRDVDYYALKARKSYITAYYYSRKADYKRAIEFAASVNNMVEKPINSFGGNEVKKLIKIDCLFTAAKVLEKASFCVNKQTKQQLLNDAKTIIEELIKIKPNAKYYLELSEILKKLGRRDESDYAAQYGFNLSPLDPLLAAQCSFVYLREYCSEPDNVGYIDKAEECIETAYWIYSREKERYRNNINVKFSYIASLYSLITTVNFIRAEGVKIDFEKVAAAKTNAKQTICLKDHRETFDSIDNGVDNSINDNVNNVPNYKRAFVIYTLLYNHCDKEGKQRAYAKLAQYIQRFKTTDHFHFDDSSAFYDFSNKIFDLDLSQKEELIVKTVAQLIMPISENI